MNVEKLELPRPALVINIGIAALAAIGITTLAGVQAQAVVGVPVLTALLTYVLLSGTRRADARAPRRGGGEGTTDPLTGLATEAVAQEALAREFSAAQRGRSLTIVLVRLEGMEKYRARHGKGVADQLLRVAGRILARHRRGMHLAARHGVRRGTFLSILSGSDRQGGAVYASRVRNALMRTTGLPPHDGVSVGVASFEMSIATPDELVQRAMYALEKGAEAGGKVMVMRERGG